MKRLRFWKKAIKLGLGRIWSYAALTTVITGGCLLSFVRSLREQPFIIIVTVVLILFLFVLYEGAYLVYREQHTLADSLQPSRRKEELGSLYGEGHSLDNRKVTNDDEFKQWIIDTAAWKDKVANILSGYSSTDAERFKNPRIPYLAEVLGSYNENHSNRRLCLHERLEFLGSLSDHL